MFANIAWKVELFIGLLGMVAILIIIKD